MLSCSLIVPRLFEEKQTDKVFRFLSFHPSVCPSDSSMYLVYSFIPICLKLFRYIHLALKISACVVVFMGQVYSFRLSVRMLVRLLVRNSGTFVEFRLKFWLTFL